MPTAKLLELLNEIYLAKFNSLAAYIIAADPYVGPGEEELLKKVQAAAAKDSALEKELSALYDKLEVFPVLRPHEAFVSELNYLSIKYLHNLLCDNLKKQLELISKAKAQAAREEGAAAIQETLAKVESEVAEELRALA